MSTTQKTQNSATEAEQKFMALLRDFHTAMLVSHGANELHARPMAVAEVANDGSLWFLTGSDSKKAFEVARDASTMAVMQGREKSRAAARYQSERALFLLLLSSCRCCEARR